MVIKENILKRYLLKYLGIFKSKELCYHLPIVIESYVCERQRLLYLGGTYRYSSTCDGVYILINPS